MTDPIQRDSSLSEWIRSNKFDVLRRLSIWMIFGGMLLYIAGEVGSTDWAIQTGIWLLLAGIAVAILYKLLSYLLLIREIDK